MGIKGTTAAATLLAALAVLASACERNASEPSAPAATANEVNGLKTPAAFAAIEGDEERSAALFTELSKVMLHPRCANCHPREGGPTQGDDMHPHNPPAVRGFGMGAAGMECSSCHGPANVEFASMVGSIPGAEPWMLAPESMGWAGASPAELCAQIKDEDLNGGRTLDDLVFHNTEDHLVNWAWHPGEGRSPAPGDQETFGALTAAWAAAGGHCPAG